MRAIVCMGLGVALAILLLMALAILVTPDMHPAFRAIFFILCLFGAVSAMVADYHKGAKP